MKVTTENIELINKRLKYLYDNFNINPLDEEVKIGDESIFIDFPDEWDEENSYYSVEEFLQYTDDLNNIQVIDNHSVIAGNIRQTIILVDEYYYAHLVPDLKFETDKYSLRIVNNPFLIGIIASRDGIYDDDFGVFPCSDYKAVELTYKKKERCEEDDIEFIKTCLYHIASKYNVPISIGEFRSWNDITDEENDDIITVSSSGLIPYCKAMDYYIQGLSIEKEDIKYLHLYKIIEYFSPIVSKKTSYEQLNKRLDALQVVERDSEYLESIFKLTKQYEVSLKDKELANTVLNECIDIVSLFQFLPDKIQRTISKSCHFEVKKITTLSPTTIEAVKREVADILYATRNSIVHAKSNYTFTGKECPEEDLGQLNEFMINLCECLFIWNGRQSKEYQLK